MNHIWIGYILNMILIAGGTFLFFQLKKFITSYISEKGKNIATKEDISEITSLVEEAKLSFIKEVETLKSELSLSNNIQVGLLEEERKAIIDYNEKYFRWVNILMNSNFIYTKEETNDLEKHQIRIDEFYQDLINSQTRLHLFVENEGLIKSADEMVLAILKNLAQLAPDCIHKLIQVNSKIKLLKLTEANDDNLEQYKVLLNEKHEHFKEFIQNMNEAYQAILPLNKQFQKDCRVHFVRNHTEKQI